MSIRKRFFLLVVMIFVTNNIFTMAPKDNLVELQAQLDEVKKLIAANMQVIMEKTSVLDQVVVDTDALAAQAHEFQSGVHKLKLNLIVRDIACWGTFIVASVVVGGILFYVKWHKIKKQLN